MNHEQFRELLQLSVYDELGEAERRRLKEHLESCQACQTELEQLRNLHHALEATRMSESFDQLLLDARQELRAVLRLERSRRPFWTRLTAGTLDAFASQPLLTGSALVRLAAGAVLMLSAGLLLGYLAFHPSGSGNPARGENLAALRDVDISNVRFADPDAKDDQIELSFDATRHVNLKGNIDDPRIQKILARALLNSQNPGVRLNAINAMKTYPRRASDRDIKQALMLALQSDENPGVRKEALTTLQKYPMDEELKRALLHVLVHDSNPGLRIEAIRSLETAAEQKRLVDQEMLGVLKETMNSDENTYVRIRARSVLQEIAQK